VGIAREADVEVERVASGSVQDGRHAADDDEVHAGVNECAE
jgi:hypothetical protein